MILTTIAIVFCHNMCTEILTEVIDDGISLWFTGEMSENHSSLESTLIKGCITIGCTWLSTIYYI